MGYFVFACMMIFLSISVVLCFINGNYIIGSFGFIFVNMMSFTIGYDLNSKEKEVFKKVD